jgi:hypothetical protein
VSEPPLPRQVTVEIYYGQPDGIPTNLIDAIAWFQGKLTGVPEEYRDSAEMHIEPVMDYGFPLCHVRVTYRRPGESVGG